EGRPGTYQVHDLFDHAPDYVTSRSQREQERKKVKACKHCGSTYHSADYRSKYCSDSCRTLRWRAGVTNRNGEARTGAVRLSDVDGRLTDGPSTLTDVDGRLSDVDTTPAPARAPALKTNPPLTPLKGGRKKSRTASAHDEEAHHLVERYQKSVAP